MIVSSGEERKIEKKESGKIEKKSNIHVDERNVELLRNEKNKYTIFMCPKIYRNRFAVYLSRYSTVLR